MLNKYTTFRIQITCVSFTRMGVIWLLGKLQVNEFFQHIKYLHKIKHYGYTITGQLVHPIIHNCIYSNLKTDTHIPTLSLSL